MKKRNFAKLLNLIIILISVIGAVPFFVQVHSVHADTEIIVNSTEDTLSDDGTCTLREAIIAANDDEASGTLPGECPAGSGGDTIIIPAGYYPLSRSDSGFEDSSHTGDLDILDDLIITGAGANVTVIDIVGNKKGRVFHILNGTVSISGLSMINGFFRDYGGGVYNESILTLNNIQLSGNTARFLGGGIFNEGILTITNSGIDNSLAGVKGGAIFNTGSINLENVTISNNVVRDLSDDDLTTLNIDLVGTEAVYDGNETLTGGGLYNANGTANIRSATFFGNGIDDTEQLLYDGGSVFVDAGTVSLKNTILAGPLNSENCSGPITSLGYNLSSDSSCAISFNQSGDLNNIDPLLEDLMNNGGQTLTHALSVGSPAIDAGAINNCPATDQRGAPRFQGNGCDIGAYEFGVFDSWVTAKEIFPDATLYEYISKPNQSRWFKFKVQPGSQVIVTLTELPENYDLTLYKDIAAAYQSLNTPEDLTRLNAEFAPDAFSPDAFSPDAFSPDAFSPDAFSPDAFSPDAFSPDAFSPDAFSPDAFSPDAFSPDAFSPDAFSPDAFSPDAFSPDAFSPDAYSPDAFSPDAFSGAQMQSLIAVSAFDGTAGEGVIVNTWDNQGDFYIRVRGRNGVYSWDAPFRLDVFLIPGQCSSVDPDSLPGTSLIGKSGGYRTIILTDPSRMVGSAGDKNNMNQRLANFAARPEVKGVIVNVSADARVAAANVQADQYPACPFAKNVVADSIKSVIVNYSALNPIEYIVIVGNDNVIPFFRHPDHAMLANEKNYAPPVLDSTASQASLKLGYILSQDRYGSNFDVSIKNNQIPIPNLYTGRLVETPLNVIKMLDVYLQTSSGKMPVPTSSLVTGYDFLEDAALAVKSELQAAINATPDTLISPKHISPEDPSAWNADQLREKLLGSRHDVIFLAGHFSANSALAADYQTRLLSEEVVNSPVDFQNVLVYSVGCHSGYNIVDSHGVPRVTREPDWAQAFARKGATLVAGTGYQYGDTDFVEYSERLYLEFTKQLRTGSGPVPIGKALAAAKQNYLENTTQMKGIHEKTLLEATLFGFPMLSIDMPGSRINQTGLNLPGAAEGSFPTTTPFNTDPGLTLGLQYSDLSVTPSLTQHQVVLKNPADGSQSTATYLSGKDGVLTNPSEPVLPLEIFDVGVDGLVARGVGFRGGTYSDLLNILPLTGAATTEIRGVHTPFGTDIFFPILPWRLNYFYALASGNSGETRLFFTPAQFRSNSNDTQLGTMRQYNSADFRIYFSNNINIYQGNSVPALSAPPDITEVNAFPGQDEIDFKVHVLGNPSAGIQEVWVIYTATSGPWTGSWMPLTLVQNAQDSTLWEATLDLTGTNAGDVRYMVQAVNGVGLVSLSTNLGGAYIPGQDESDKEPTSVSLEVPQNTSNYGSKVTVSAVLTSMGTPLAGMKIQFGLGSLRKFGITDSSGRATVTMALLGIPGQYDLKATFKGSPIFQSSTTSTPFTITKTQTVLTLDPTNPKGDPDEEGLVTAILSDANDRRLSEKSVFFIFTGANSSYSESVITDYAGRARPGKLSLPPGYHTIEVYFSGNIPLPGYPISLEDQRFEPTSTTGTLFINYPYNLQFMPFVIVP